MTLEQVYEKWLDWKTTPNNAENIRRIQTAWKTYYLNKPMSKPLLEKPIAKITSLDLRNWAESLMKKHLPDKKKFSRMFTIINQCYEYASDESQVFPDEERRQIKGMVYDDLKHYPKHSSSAGL